MVDAVRAICLFACLGSTVVLSAAERLAPIFVDVGPAAAVPAVAQSGIRQRVAEVDLEALGDVRRRVREGSPAQVGLNLWPDSQFDALIERTRRTSGGYSLSGRLAGIPHGATTLVVNGDVVVGTVWTPSGLYDIRTVDGVQVVRQVDVASLPPLAEPVLANATDWPRWAPQPSRKYQSSDANANGRESDDGSVVDLLVLWTAAAAKHVGGIDNVKALIDLGVANANDAYARSGVAFRLSLVGSEQTDIPDTVSIRFPAPEEEQAWEEALAASWDAAYAVRDRVGADILTVVMLMGPLGGIAMQMQELSADFEELAFNLVSVERLPYTTLAHEIGHNMGLQHDRHVNPVGGVFPYSHGYVNQRAFDPRSSRDSCWVTIMAYLGQCFLGQHRLGVRIPYFSNPDKRFPNKDGDPLGVAENSEFTDARGPANAVASLNKVRHVVANFRPSRGDQGGATDHGDTASDATALLVQSTTRGLLEPNDVDYFRIDVPRTGSLRVETSGTTDTQGTLTSAGAGADFPGAQDGNSGQDANFRIEEHVKAGGYLVAVRGEAGAQGPYRLHVSLDWLRVDDHGDSPQEATRVATPSATDGVLGVDDVDYFRIDLDEAATLRVETSGSVDTYGKLAWPDGRAVLENDDGGRNRNFRIETGLPAGTYVVEVRGFAARAAGVSQSIPATGFYTLNVWFGPDGGDDDHGDVFATATKVGLASVTAGALETALDVDTFRFDLPSLGTLRVQTSGNTDTHGSLASAEGTIYSSSWVTDDDGGAGSNFLLEETLGRGAYAVEVRGFHGATTGPYELHVSFAPVADDHGDTEQDATAIALPSTSSGRIDAPNDEDYFRVTLPEPGTLAVDIESSWVYDTSALVQRGGLIALPNADGHIRAAKLPAGDYFIVVRSERSLPAILPSSDPYYAYQVHASFTPDATDDHGDTFGTATAVALPATTTGELEQGRDVDIFRVDPPSGVRGRLRARTTGSTNTRGSVYALDSWGWFLRDEDDDSGEDGNFAMELVVSGNRHFVQVRGANEETTGPYALELSFEAQPLAPDDHGNTPDAASVVGLGSTTGGELHDPSDRDVFRIDVLVEGVLRVETTGGMDTVGYLAAENGAWMAEDDNDGDAFNFRLERWVPSGVYFVTVRSWRDAPGPYALKVSLTSTTILPGQHTVPLLLSARQAPARLGLLRLVNHSPEPGTVEIRAIDDSADERGPVVLALAAGHAAHLDAHDLEMGNPAKGLSAGVGAGQGDWRLRLGTDLDIEPLAYMYTQDGFLTAMHDTVPANGLRHEVPLFNPASNRAQASRLRLINGGAQDAEVAIAGVDDGGAEAPGGRVTLTLPGGAARTLTAAQLETGDAALRGRLGDGAGKWRLTVSATHPVVAMALVEGVGGKLTNVSTCALANDGLPLLLSGNHHGMQGFARVLNASDVGGEVVVHATDDAGRRFGPLALTLGARAAAHFNSTDLEQGNAAKGLSGSTGAGAGDWRLHFTTNLDIKPLAYARGPGGFFVAMHDVVRKVGETHHVPIFEPASSLDPASELRIANVGDEDATVTITGTDDRGQAAPAGAVSLTLAAQEARAITARQLEEGGAMLVGALGDGDGKWRLAVAADAPIQVLNLLRGADGRMSNLSTSLIGPMRRTPAPIMAVRGLTPVQ